MALVDTNKARKPRKAAQQPTRRTENAVCLAAPHHVSSLSHFVLVKVAGAMVRGRGITKRPYVMPGRRWLRVHARHEPKFTVSHFKNTHLPLSLSLSFSFSLWPCGREKERLNTLNRVHGSLGGTWRSAGEEKRRKAVTRARSPVLRGRGRTSEERKGGTKRRPKTTRETRNHRRRASGAQRGKAATTTMTTTKTTTRGGGSYGGRRWLRGRKKWSTDSTTRDGIEYLVSRFGIFGR